MEGWSFALFTYLGLSKKIASKKRAGNCNLSANLVLYLRLSEGWSSNPWEVIDNVLSHSRFSLFYRNTTFSYNSYIVTRTSIWLMLGMCLLMASRPWSWYIDSTPRSWQAWQRLSRWLSSHGTATWPPGSLFRLGLRLFFLHVLELTLSLAWALSPSPLLLLY